MDTVGFVGLGIMGQGMAMNLVRAGYDTVVWNRTTLKAKELVDAGATLATSPADVAARCNVVMICVSDTPDVEAVVSGPNGIAEGLRPDGLIIDHSTISPEATKRLAESISNLDG
ncbi:MAG: NAD(P)-binding domain-containing protein, partial [Actinomycetota bacterium]